MAHGPTIRRAPLRSGCPFAALHGQYARASPGTPGFSLIELVVVLGIVMILIGLALPALQRSWWSARATSNLVVMRQNAVLIGQYTEDFKGVYPFSGDERSVGATFNWYRPMVAGGYFAAARESDPSGFRRYGRTNMVMSECMVHPPERFLRGNTQPEELRRAAPVRVNDVTFPSAKGLMQCIRIVEDRIDTYWCCVEGAPAGPVAFADGSASIEYWLNLLPEQRYEPDANGIGSPVSQTWGGAKGRDRQR